MLTRRIAPRATSAATVRFFHVPMSQPIGQGNVRKLDFDFHKPTYVAQNWLRTNAALWTMFMYGWVPLFSVCSGLILINHGAGTSRFPPDPHALWN
jgi:hypothetical protein